MDEAIATYRAASERADIASLMTAIASDAELVSPISGRMVFRGAEDLRFLFDGVYSTITDLHWDEALAAGSSNVLVGTFRVGPLRGSDAMALDLGPDGRIVRIRPHLRPWLATTLFALILGPKIVRRPGIVLRALR